MLSDEPGMSELMNLYLDDEYDYSNGKFTGMSDAMKSQFSRDLNTFYTAFTGNSNMPDDIKKFSDIKLRTYNLANGCKQDDILKNGHLMSQNDELFIKYAKNLKQMIYNAQTNQQKLLSIINELFVLVSEPYGENKKIRVNPKLTDTILQSLMDKTRNIIIQLYVTCEKDFEKGIHLYEAIVERKILETTKHQISNLLHKEQTILETSKNISLPSVVNSNNNVNLQQNNSDISTMLSETPLENNISSTIDTNTFVNSEQNKDLNMAVPRIEPKQTEVIPQSVIPAASPEIASPEIKQPEIASPEIASPEIASPEIASPEIASPEIKPPEIASPEIKPPEIKPPEIASPEITPLNIPEQNNIPSLNTLVPSNGNMSEPVKEQNNIPSLNTLVPSNGNVQNMPEPVKKD
jgi:hypothetical protein